MLETWQETRRLHRDCTLSPTVRLKWSPFRDLPEDRSRLYQRLLTNHRSTYSTYMHPTPQHHLICSWNKSTRRWLYHTAWLLDNSTRSDRAQHASITWVLLSEILTRYAFATLSEQSMCQEFNEFATSRLRNKMSRTWLADYLTCVRMYYVAEAGTV